MLNDVFTPLFLIIVSLMSRFRVIVYNLYEKTRKEQIYWHCSQTNYSSTDVPILKIQEFSSTTSKNQVLFQDNWGELANSRSFQDIFEIPGVSRTWCEPWVYKDFSPLLSGHKIIFVLISAI